jgi:hypothetical protein
MASNNKKFLIIAGAAAIAIAAGVTFTLSNQSTPVPTTAVQGAIGERNVYRDSKETGAAVDAASNKEFEKLYTIGQFKALSTKPEFKELAADARFAALLNSADFQAMMSDKAFLSVIKSGEFERARSIATERSKASIATENLATERTRSARALATENLATERRAASADFEALIANARFQALVANADFAAVLQRAPMAALVADAKFAESMVALAAQRR